MSEEQLQNWFSDFVMRARARLANKDVEIDYCVLYEALRKTMTMKDVFTIIEQEQAA
jgi:hypothetical protein